MPLLILFAFLGGVVTILSPCILPILPIVLSGSLTGGKRRPLGVVTGFIVSFTFFTLFLTSIVNVLGVSADILRNLAVIVLALFGIALILPQAQIVIERLFSRFASRIPQAQGGSGFGGGILVGLSLGLIWTPCVGPILASVISLALTGSVTGGAAIITLAYALGTALPMLIIMYGGRLLLQRVPWLLNNAGRIQKAFGVLMIITALGIYFNVDRQFQAYILEKFPNYGAGLTSFEDNEAVLDQLDELDGAGNKLNRDNIGKPMSDLMPNTPSGPAAPELILGGEWLNSEPLTLAELAAQGKVVLIDFMTYSCINCIRTFPSLNAWHSQYADDGLVIIGVHTPEFEFEKDAGNVRDALADFGIEFSVMQDNDYATWRAYGNRYWPRKYLIDHTGHIIYDHIGEGKYEETEEKIREALAAAKRARGLAARVDDDMTNVAVETTQARSPEVYFGSSRNNLLGNGTKLTAGTQSFNRPQTIEPNMLYLVGTWNITPEYAEAAGADARIIFRYYAKKIFMVAGSDTAVTATVTQDSAPAGSITVDAETLYTLMENAAAEEHVIEIAPEPGFQAFTFTFG